MDQIDIRVSVLLSTCNRCDKLRLFLEAMKTGGSFGLKSTEVLVVDNNSSDATKQVVAEYLHLENPSFRYLRDDKPGKSRALNTAIRQARGDIIAFTDDDCIPDSGWVDGILKEFDSDPELSVLGGRVELYDPNDTHQATLLSNSRTLVKTAKGACHPPTIIGANMSFRRAVLDVTRGFDPVLGPGTICKAAEDLDLIYRSLRKHFKIAYSPDVVVFHNHGRRTEAEDNKTSRAYALGRGAFYFKFLLRLDVQVAMVALGEVFNLVRTLAKGMITRKRFSYHRLTLPALFRGAFYYCRAQFQ